MTWTKHPQADKDIAPTYTMGGWVLRCIISAEDRTMWAIERIDRAPITDEDSCTMLFLAHITITDYEEGIVNLFDLASAYIEKHELSKH